MKNFDLTAVPRKESGPPKNSDVTAQKEMQMKNLISLIRCHAKEKRCFMEVAFMEVDKRKLGILDENTFWTVLSDFGLSQILSDKEKHSLMLKYKRSVKVEAISATGTLSHPSVNYLKFCRDILPTSLRVLKDEDAWKTDRVPEISVTTKALEKYVQTVRAHKLFEETETRRRSILSGDHSAVDMYEGKKNGTDCGLDPWEILDLSRIITAAEAAATTVSETDGKKSGSKGTPVVSNNEDVRFSLQQCEEIFKNMCNFKKIPEFGVQHSLNILFQNNPDGGSSSEIRSTVFRASVGCPQRSILVGAGNGTNTASGARNASAPKTRKIESARGGRPVTTIGENKVTSELDKIFRNPPVRWRDMDTEELQTLENKLFSQSNLLLDKLLRGREKEGLSDLVNETMNLGISATRLGGRKTRKSVPKDYYNPSEMTAIAGNRSDVIVLPNLKKTLSLACMMSDKYGDKGGLSPGRLSATNLTEQGSGSRSGLGVSGTRTSEGKLGRNTNQFSSSFSGYSGKGWAPGTSTLTLG